MVISGTLTIPLTSPGPRIMH
uniref:Uncharacterized protein n=1 Tax=Rhizophora mucronata TaxID=61149 RepID=A0A2P2MZC6_RHIMU